MYYINKTYRIDQDKYNYILQRKGVPKKDNTETWTTLAFFQTLKQLYHYLVEIGLKQSSLDRIEDFIGKVEELHSLIEKMPDFAKSGEE